jgi:hypothetical protein
MRVSMSLFRNEHGVWGVRKKVPKKLEDAVATVLGNGKKRQSWLQRSLRTKDRREAQRLAPPVLMEFDRVLANAETLNDPCGQRSVARRYSASRTSSTPMSLTQTRRDGARVTARLHSKISQGSSPKQE